MRVDITARGRYIPGEVNKNTFESDYDNVLRKQREPERNK
jgi:hypothetical protein